MAIVFWPPKLPGNFASGDCCGKTGPPNKDSFEPKPGKPLRQWCTVRPILLSLTNDVLGLTRLLVLCVKDMVVGRWLLRTVRFDISERAEIQFVVAASLVFFGLILQDENRFEPMYQRVLCFLQKHQSPF